jgi:transposase InsO family protein
VLPRLGTNYFHIALIINLIRKFGFYRYRKILLSAYVFQSLSDVREKIQKWVTDYNENRPHRDLKYLTPKEVYDKRI